MAARKKLKAVAAETVAQRKARSLRILAGLKKAYPDARCELDFKDPWQLLVAVVLAAQCTDVNVNKATPALFARYPSPREMAATSAEDVEPFIRTLGLFRNKAKALVMTARALMEHHGGSVPNSREALQALSGVGRKTASVVLANAFHVPALAVDTHVGRLSRRMGLTIHEDPDKVEADLCALWPREEWIDAHHAMILLGRRVCGARKPDCANCLLLPDCPQKAV
jgi:endonuclease-3